MQSLENHGEPMTQPDIIQTILKDSDYHLDLFTDPEVQALREKIFHQNSET